MPGSLSLSLTHRWQICFLVILWQVVNPEGVGNFKPLARAFSISGCAQCEHKETEMSPEHIGCHHKSAAPISIAHSNWL
jgi:hypothetical protein